MTFNPYETKFKPNPYCAGRKYFRTISSSHTVEKDALRYIRSTTALALSAFNLQYIAEVNKGKLLSHPPSDTFNVLPLNYQTCEIAQRAE